MDSESGGTPSGSINGRPEFVSRFADEVPAQAPDRELPAELEPSQRSFIDSLDSVYKIMHEPDLLGGVVKNIMMELARNPEYRKLVSPTDVHVMIRGMRDSMGMARIKKEESKSKRAGGSKRTSKRVDDLETLAALDEVFGAGDFN